MTGLMLDLFNPAAVSLVIFVFVITSITSTYMISYNHQLFSSLSRLLSALHLKNLGKGDERGEQSIRRRR